ncbi:suppressor of ty3 [Culex quinquefasciatus]|uniref:Suppressor of ty3 n=1 Tax=Culex quinquefasciatus TaxID=7176 RepID=B0X4S7_CULQU|nr:suppressor of ty3 [Culex quinquefasciatus]|eukprot:XP_001864649.1 suppressor of ty3 [Culex quinquefasciatus]
MQHHRDKLNRSGEYDAYANLMSEWDKQKLLGIQLTQLNTITPYYINDLLIKTALPPRLFLRAMNRPPMPPGCYASAAGMSTGEISATIVATPPARKINIVIHQGSASLETSSDARISFEVATLVGLWGASGDYIPVFFEEILQIMRWYGDCANLSANPLRE